MANELLALHLNREQQSHLLAHALTYQISLVSNPTVLSDNKQTLEIVRKVSYRLFQLCKNQGKEGIFLFSREEGQVLKQRLLVLQPLYEQWAMTEAYMLALQGLSICRKLLQEAEQQTNA